ncbi:MAG: 1-acyl-sn-glycerol-3-phosphate acyltransferase [Candidatus Omnitrophica bacterium]|nr:1-acyl-sn-glycerol-3-phosphate acyltransferase [Candidatus Omnitrophota bacterium]
MSTRSDRNKFYRFVCFVLWVFLSAFYRFRVVGRENVPRRGGCLIASNHLSHMDPVVLSVASPRALCFMAKRELFANRWFGRLIGALNAFPVDRSRGDIKALREGLTQLRQGGTMIIFPEGTRNRSRSGDLGAAEQGVGMLAIKAGVPVVPTLIIGTDKVIPVGVRRIFFFKPITVYFGKPVQFNGTVAGPAERGKYQEFADFIVEEIKKMKKSLQAR